MPRKSGNTNPGKEHDVGGQSLTCGMCPWSQQAKKKDVWHTELGSGTVWKAGGGKFSFLSHQTAEIFIGFLEFALHMAVSMILLQFL